MALKDRIAFGMALPHRSPEPIDMAAVRQVIRLIQVNEYKRRQAPPVVRITPRSFGKDWRYPITSRFRPGG